MPLELEDAGSTQFTKPFRWEIMAGDAPSGVCMAGEATTQVEARIALAAALASYRGASVQGVVWRVTGPARPPMEVVETASPPSDDECPLTQVPIRVALGLVTGRRLHHYQHDSAFAAMLDWLAFAVAGGTPTQEQETSQAFFAAVLRRARQVFPALAHETGDELEGMPELMPAWLVDREALYGALIAPRRS